MSVDSYFPGPPDTRMPETPGATDAIGIRYEGPILSGKLGVRQAFQEQARELTGPRESSLPPLGSGITFAPAPIPEPQTNAADRLVSVDPVLAYQRSQFGRTPSTTYVHPQQYDPVLRSHLNMEPLPDPYEAQRRRHANWLAIRDKKIR